MTSRNLNRFSQLVAVETQLNVAYFSRSIHNFREKNNNNFGKVFFKCFFLEARENDE